MEGGNELLEEGERRERRRMKGIKGGLSGEEEEEEEDGYSIEEEQELLNYGKKKIKVSESSLELLPSHVNQLIRVITCVKAETMA